MSEAEQQLRSEITNSLLRFGETTESDKEYLLKAAEVLSDELDKLEERMEESGLLDELDLDEFYEDRAYDEEDDEEDPYGLFTSDMPLYGTPDEDDDYEDY